MKSRAAELRQDFDRSFALPPDESARDVDGMLAITVASTSCLVRLREVAHLVVDKKITWLPTPVAELRGIAGLQGTVLPVYDLAMLLGLAKAPAPRWLLVAAAAPVGLAFDRFDGYEDAAADAFVSEVGAKERVGHIRELLQTGIRRPVVHLPSVLETIRNRAARGSTA